MENRPDINQEPTTDQIPEHLGEEWGFWWPTDETPPRKTDPDKDSSAT